MKFESEFNIGDEVYILVDNRPTSCIVRKIVFPTPTIWSRTCSNGSILYYLAKSVELNGNIFNQVFNQELDHDIKQYERFVGKTIEELFDKYLEAYKDY